MLIPEHELAFAAGLMEGEGTIRIQAFTARNRGILHVSCVNTDPELIRFLQDRWPGWCRPSTGRSPRQRPAMRWNISARMALAFLEAIEPYVVTQRMRDRISTARDWQAVKAIPWQRRTAADYEEEWRAHYVMRWLNGRGVEGYQHPAWEASAA